jgi:hypothetical protein
MPAVAYCLQSFHWPLVAAVLVELVATVLAEVLACACSSQSTSLHHRLLKLKWECLQSADQLAISILLPQHVVHLLSPVSRQPVLE